MKKRTVAIVLVMITCILFIPSFSNEADAAPSGAGPKIIEGGKRDFKWPVPGINRISSCFIDPMGHRSSHSAIDINNPAGATIYASYPGYVIWVNNDGNGGGFGNYVIIRHSYVLGTGKTITLYTRYSHLKSTYVSGTKNKPTWVSAGDRIGEMGNTGGPYGVHLDFQILYGCDDDSVFNYQRWSIDPFINELLELPSNLNANGADGWCRCCYEYVDYVKELYKTPCKYDVEIKSSWNCDLTVTTKNNNVSAWSLPGSNETYPDSHPVGKFTSAGMTFHATRIIENKVTGHYWYETIWGPTGKTCYVYVPYTKDEPKLNWTIKESNVDKPGTLNAGAIFNCRGTLSTEGSTIKTVQGLIYSGNASSGTPRTKTQEIQVNSNTCNLKNTIDSTLYFDDIKEAGKYTYAVRVKLGGFTIKNGKPTALPDQYKYAFTHQYTVGSPKTTYTVTLNSNGGSVDKSSYSYNSQDVIGTLPNPTLNGYVFLGWYDNLSGGNLISENIKVTKNMTLYARWMHVGTKLNFNLNGGSFQRISSAEENSYTYRDYENSENSFTCNNYAAWFAAGKYGQEFTYLNEMPVPCRDGFVFAGWQPSLGGSLIYWNSGYAGNSYDAVWVPADSASPSDHMEFNGHYYERYDYHMTWTQAQAFCEARGGHLVAITDQAEQDAVFDLVSAGPNNTYYIGATDAAQEGSWKWVSGETVSFNKWDPQAPEPNGGTGENYAQMMAVPVGENKQPGEWVDTADATFGSAYSISASGFVCEYEKSSLCDHAFTFSVSVQPTRTETGLLNGSCTLCGENKSVVLPQLNEHDYVSSVVHEPSCSVAGITQYIWNSGETGEFVFEAEDAIVPHQYQSVRTEPTCETFGAITYTCSVCGDSYVETITDEWTEWSETYPEGIDESLIEQVTQYRYRDYQTVTTEEGDLEGYELTGSKWVQDSAGYVDYVQSWPSGFNTSHNLYSTYNKTPRIASETENTKLEVSSAPIGYIYYHWCRGTYTGGPINRSTSPTRTDTFNSFHAFYSTSSAPQYDKDGRNGGDSRYFANGNVCRDSHWYYPITVYRQTYKEYVKQNTFGAWNEWTEWNESAAEVSSIREVETRNVYRYAVPPKGAHEWDDGVITAEATCTEDGVKTYTCAICGKTKEEAVKATGHDYKVSVVNPTCTEAGYTEHICTICGDNYRDEETTATGHTWDTGVVTTPPGPGTVGIRTFTCTVCDEFRTEEIAALPITYTIWFDANGGFGTPNSQVKEKYVDLKLSSIVPTRAGYHFLGWAELSTATTAQYIPGGMLSKDSDLTLYAVWSNTFTVTFDANGGENNPESQLKTQGKPLCLTENIPVKTGYNFLGWAKNRAATEPLYLSGSEYSLDQDLKLYAVWEAKKLELTFEPNKGTVYPESIVVTYGERYEGIPTPFRENCDFSGWYDYQSEIQIENGAKVLITEDTTVYASWIIAPLTITYDMNGGAGSIDSQRSYGEDLKITTEKPTREGYNFVGWAYSANALEPDFIGNDIYERVVEEYEDEQGYLVWDYKDSDFTLYAVWTPKDITVTFNANGGETETTEKTIPFNSEYGNLPEPSRNGYQFLGWFTSVSAGTLITETSLVENTDNHTIYAHWMGTSSAYSGKIEPNITWSVDLNSRIFTVTGNGELPGKNTTLQTYAALAETIVIGNGITSIGANAFCNTWSLRNVEIASSVQSIGDYAFYGCSNLSTVDIPASVGKIGVCAFNHCKSLSGFTVSPGNTSYQAIDGVLFTRQGMLLNMPEGKNTLNYSTPEETTGIMDYAFLDNSIIETITLSTNVTVIGNGAFQGCTALKNVLLSNSIGEIGSYAFQNCSNLQRISIPPTIQCIGKNAFNNCIALQHVDFPDETLQGCIIEDLAFSNCAALSEIRLPGGVTKLGSSPFQLCNNLSHVVIPSSVEEAPFAFLKTDKLKSAGPIGSNSQIEFGWETDVPAHAFDGSGITFINLPDGIVNIGTGAFENTAIKAINIPSSTKTIGERAFANCEFLADVLFHVGLESIGKEAFSQDTNLRSVRLPEGLMELGPYAFDSCYNLISADIPGSVTTIEKGAFIDCSRLNSVKIGAGIITIGENAFQNCALGDITLPTTLQNIERSAFRYSSIHSVEIPGAVTSLGAYSFYNCTNLQELVIHSGMVTIQTSAFSGCLNLKTVILPETIETIQNSAFRSCGTNGGTFVLSKNLRLVGEGAFKNSHFNQIYYQGSVSQWANVTIGADNNELVVTSFDDVTGMPVEISLDSTGGICEKESLILIIGDPYGTLPPATKEGFVQTGWFTEPEGGDQIYPETVVNYSEDQTLYAQWSPADSVIILYYNDGTEGTKQVQKLFGEEYVFTSDGFDRAGYQLAGFTSTKDGKEPTYCTGEVYTEETDIVLYAIWEANTYHVSFDADGGSQVTGIDVVFDSPLGELPVSERNGYRFEGWTLNGEAVNENTKLQTASDVTLKAAWIPETYSIIYDANGGSGAPDAQEKIHNVELRVPDLAPVKTGYEFMGWSKNAEETEARIQPTDIITDNQNLTLYAVWKAKTITVSFAADGGTITTNSKIAIYGNEYGELPVPTRAGYTFDGWGADDGARITENSIVQTAASHTLTAQWIPNEYVITFDANGGNRAPEQQVKLQGIGMILTAEYPVRPGYEFLGWSESALDDSALYPAGSLFNRDENTVLYAVWKNAEMIVTFEADGGTNVSDKTVSYSEPYGALPETSKDNYVFEGWYTQSGGGTVVTAETVVSATGNHTLYARWSPARYAITFDANGGNCELSEKYVLYGSQIGELPEAEREGSVLAGWYTYPDGTAVSQADVYEYSGSITLYARWETEEYTINYDLNGGSGSIAAQTKIYGEPLVLSTIIPTREGYIFLGWTPNHGEAIARYASGDPYVQNQNVTLYAVWSAAVESPIRLLSNPSDACGLLGQKASFSVVAEGSDLSYEWQTSEDNGEIWKSIGAESSTLSVIITADNIGSWYRCLITDLNGNTLVTEEARLSLLPCLATITQQPQDYYGYHNDMATFTVETDGHNLTYQWYYSDDYGQTWQKATGTGNATQELRERLETNSSGRLFHCTVTDANGQSVTSDDAKLALKSSEIEITEQPQTIFGKLNQDYSITVLANGENLTYLWYVSYDAGDTWVVSDDGGHDTAELRIRLTAQRDGSLYRCLIQSGKQIAVFSDDVGLFLDGTDTVITLQPENMMVMAGETATIQVKASGTGLSYKWFRKSSEPGSEWQETGIAANTFTEIALLERSGNQYYCMITGQNGENLISDTVTLTVDDSIVFKLPKALSIIESEAFAGVSATYILIPSSTSMIETNAFSGCDNLLVAEFQTASVEIHDGAFENCPKLTIVAPSGGRVEQYALSNSIPFIDLHD